MNIKEVKSAIEHLERLNIEDECAYEKAILVYSTIEKLPKLTASISKGTILFRARIHKEHEEYKFFEKISDISLQLSSDIESFGRCNKPGQSKFYCSIDRPTSFAELLTSLTDKKKGNKIYVTIGRWRLKTSLSAVIVTTPDKENRICEYDQKYGSRLDNFIEQSEPDIREATVILYRFLFEKFRAGQKDKDINTYTITAAYCNSVLDHLQSDVDSIYYPSVRLPKQGVNFAINNEFVRLENIELIGAMKNELSVDSVQNGYPSCREIGKIDAQQIDVNNNRIIW